MTRSTMINLTPAARRWVLDHGGAMMLRQSLRHGCCGGSARVPVAEIGQPCDPADYTEHQHDGIRIFLSSAFNFHDSPPITVDLAGLWRWRRLVVEGIEIKTKDAEAS